MVSLVVNWKKAALNDITQNPTSALNFTNLKLYVASSFYNSVTDHRLYQSTHTCARSKYCTFYDALKSLSLSTNTDSWGIMSCKLEEQLGKLGVASRYLAYSNQRKHSFVTQFTECPFWNYGQEEKNYHSRIICCCYNEQHLKVWIQQ